MWTPGTAEKDALERKHAEASPSTPDQRLNSDTGNSEDTLHAYYPPQHVRHPVHPHDSPVRQVVLDLFHRWGNRATEIKRFAPN